MRSEASSFYIEKKRKHRKDEYPSPAMSCLSLHRSVLFESLKSSVIVSLARRRLYCLVDFLLLVDAELTGAHVDEEEETTTVEVSCNLKTEGKE